MNENMIDKEKTQALGSEKIPRLLLRYAIPSIIAMLSSSLYNMIDSIFIGHGVGAMAISGLAITMPIMNVIAALGTLVSVGAATLMSVKLGQGDKASAEYILGNLVVLNIIIGLTRPLSAIFSSMKSSISSERVNTRSRTRGSSCGSFFPRRWLPMFI